MKPPSPTGRLPRHPDEVTRELLRIDRMLFGISVTADGERVPPELVTWHDNTFTIDFAEAERRAAALSRGEDSTFQVFEDEIDKASAFLLPYGYAALVDPLGEPLRFQSFAPSDLPRRWHVLQSR